MLTNFTNNIADQSQNGAINALAEAVISGRQKISFSELSLFELRCIRYALSNDRALNTYFDQGAIEQGRHALAWSYPQFGNTYNVDFKFCGCDLNREMLGIVAQQLIMSRAAVLTHPTAVQRLQINSPRLSSAVFIDQYKMRMFDIIALYNQLLHNPEAELTASFPRTLAAIGTLALEVLKDVQKRAPLINPRAFGDLKDRIGELPEAFGNAGSRFSTNTFYTLESHAWNCDPPVFPNETEKLLTLLENTLCTDTIPSLFSKRKINNVLSAQEAAYAIENATVDSVLGINKIILNGLRRESGLLRTTELTVGNVRKACIKPDEIHPALERLLLNSHHINVSGVEQRFLAAAEFAAQFQFIHPTPDGNGRTGHVLTNRLLKRLALPSFNPPVRAYETYIIAIDAAVEGQYAPLIRLFERYSQTI